MSDTLTTHSITVATTIAETVMALSMFTKNNQSHSFRTSEKNGVFTREWLDMSSVCSGQEHAPSKMIFHDMNDPDRLYSRGFDDLVTSPEKMIGDGLEVVLIDDDGVFKWVKVLPMRSPKGLVAVGCANPMWYEMHYKTVSKNGEGIDAITVPFAMRGGRLLLLKAMGWKGYNAAKDRQESETTLSIMLSVKEDMMRSGALTVTVKDDVTLMFPVSTDAKTSFFKLRDGLRDTPSGARNRLFHWCNTYYKKGASGPVKVKGHLRGTHRISHDGFEISISESSGYTDYLPD